MTTETTTWTDPRLNGLDPASELYRRAERALATYDEKTSGVDDCFDAWSDDSLISVDVEPFTADGRTYYNIRNPQPIGDVARSYLDLAADWWRAVTGLADDLAGSTLNVPEPLDELVTAEARDALAARDKVLVSWARLTLGTAGPTPTDLGGYVETDGTSIYL